VKIAPKDKKGKARISLIPMDILRDLAIPGYEEGCEKYERESWRKGFPISDLFDACQRHLIKFFYDGEDYDPDPIAAKYKKLHLAGALFCIMSMYWTLRTRPELDDRPLKVLAKGASKKKLSRFIRVLKALFCWM
jgi:hypothetical protein